MSGQAPVRRPGGPMGGGPMGMQLGASDAKARDFRGTLKRFSHRLQPERWIILLVLVLAATSVFLAVLGPKLLGNATNLIFESSNDFLRRTLITGSDVCDITSGMIENFADVGLMLPNTG